MTTTKRETQHTEDRAMTQHGRTVYFGKGKRAEIMTAYREWTDELARTIDSHADLLAALEAVLDKPDDVTVYEAIERARAAIRKAKGE